MVQLCRKILEYIGITPNRLRLEWVSAGEGIRFANIMNEFSKEIKEIGPLGQDEEIKDSELHSRISEVIKLIPYIKLAKRNKLTLSLGDNHTAYEELYSSQEIERIFSDPPSYYIDPEKCQACSRISTAHYEDVDTIIATVKSTSCLSPLYLCLYSFCFYLVFAQLITHYPFADSKLPGCLGLIPRMPLHGLGDHLLFHCL